MAEQSGHAGRAEAKELAKVREKVHAAVAELVAERELFHCDQLRKICFAETARLLFQLFQLPAQRLSRNRKRYIGLGFGTLS